MRDMVLVTVRNGLEYLEAVQRGTRIVRPLTVRPARPALSISMLTWDGGLHGQLLLTRTCHHAVCTISSYQWLSFYRYRIVREASTKHGFRAYLSVNVLRPGLGERPVPLDHVEHVTGLSELEH